MLASRETIVDLFIEQTRETMLVKEKIPRAGIKTIVGNHSAPLDMEKKEIQIF